MTKKDGKYLDVVLPLAVKESYTYTIPKHFHDKDIEPGMRVSVQFGKRKLYTALVLKRHNDKPEYPDVKDIVALLEDSPSVTPQQIKFWEWVSSYYMCSLGEVFVAAMPSGFRLAGESRLYYNGKEEDEPQALKEREKQIVFLVKDNPGIELSKLSAELGIAHVMPAIRLLMDKGLLLLEENLKESVKPKTIEYLRLGKNYRAQQELDDLLEKIEKRAPKQYAFLAAYLELAGYEPSQDSPASIPKNDIVKQSGISASIAKAMISKDVFELDKVEVSRLQQTDGLAEDSKELNPNQERALREIKEKLTVQKPILLHGVTSSGKTEIYIHLIQEQLIKGKQVLYLLPEIALTTQIINRLRKVFGSIVGVYHSKFNDAERIEIWNNLLGHVPQGATKYQVILGVRSSVFLPFKDLGLIIVDEEHENSYKQFDPAPRYHARDASIVLAHMHQAKVLLGTATPSLESYFNVHIGKYGLVELFERHRDIQLPEMQIVDTRRERKRKRMHSHFSPQLMEEMEGALQNGEQIILFQNRRGFSPYQECSDCGWVPECKHCDVSLTYHKSFNRLICHYCGYSLPVSGHCHDCGSSAMETRGFGTEKVEDEIKIMFPEAKVARMDQDSTRKKRAHERILAAFEAQEVDILIGTQMVSKGLDFDHVSLVGILSADNMLNFPDFRSYERAFQLMTQVSGRAGRKNKRGKVLVQTSNPDNPVIAKVVQGDFKALFEEQLAERSEYLYPPEYRLIRLTIKHKNKDTLTQASNQLANMLRQKFKSRVIGPEYPLIARLQTWYQKCILIKVNRDKNLSPGKLYIQECISFIQSQEGMKSTQVLIDVDPY